MIAAEPILLGLMPIDLVERLHGTAQRIQSDLGVLEFQLTLDHLHEEVLPTLDLRTGRRDWLTLPEHTRVDITDLKTELARHYSSWLHVELTCDGTVSGDPAIRLKRVKRPEVFGV